MWSDFIPKGTRVINALQIGRALLGENIDKNKPIKSMMCWNANPVTQAPETEKIIKGLEEDLFLVSAEHFVSDTALYADILLPASMGAEHKDMILSWGHLYLTYNEKCVEPPGEAISNNDIFQKLAKLMGYNDEQFSWE